MKKLKKIFKKFKYLDNTKFRYYSMMSFLMAFILFVGTTYSYFNFTKHISSATISIANLKYVLSSQTSGYTNGSVTVSAGETKFLDLELKSMNDVKTKYALNYLDISGIEVYYSETVGNNVRE